MSHTPQDFDKAVEQLPVLDKQIAEKLPIRVDQSEAYQCLVEAMNEQEISTGSKSKRSGRLRDLGFKIREIAEQLKCSESSVYRDLLPDYRQRNVDQNRERRQGKPKTNTGKAVPRFVRPRLRHAVTIKFCVLFVAM